MAERLKKAISFGDLSENAAYHEAKEAQSFLEGRINELETLINQAVITNKKPAGNKVDIGVTVIIEQISNKEKDKFIIMGSAIEADALKGKISIDSPLGKELLNKRVGDTVKIKLPNGETINYKIIKIE